MSASVTLLERILRAFAVRRIAVAAVAMAIMAIAAVSLVQMPLQLLPEVRYPQVRIIGDLPGQTSRVIEESINEPLEAALAGLPGMVRLESRSGDGRAYLDLYFEPAHDLDRAIRDVTQAAQRAQSQIPAEFPEPRIFAVSTMEDPVLQFAFGSSELSAAEVRQRLRSSLLPRLRAVRGVDAVFIGREEVRELVVDVDPKAQSRLQVSLQEIEALLREATDPPSSGALRSSSFEGVGILGDSGWDSERLGERLMLLGELGDRHVSLDSVARTYRASSEESLRTRLDGESAVLLTVHRSADAHSLRLAREVRGLVQRVGDSSGFESIQTTLLYDDSVVTQSAVRSVLVAALGGSFLAMLLLFLTLRQKRYIPLVALLVGVSLAAAVIVLNFMGMTLNLLTLAGLLLSVGLGLDYAIIYFDRLDRMHRKVDEAGDIHVRAMARVAGPLSGAMLTTLAAILPFLLVEGLVARLFEPLIWTVVVCAVFSYLFALILLPTFVRGSAACNERPSSPRTDRVWGLLHRPWLSWVVIVLLLNGLFWGSRALPFEVLPVVDDGFVDLRMTHPAGIPMADLDALTQRVEAKLLNLKGSDAVFSTVGGYFREGLPSYRPGTANFMVRVDTSRAGSSAEWADAARAAVADLQVPQLNLSVSLPRIRGVQTRLADADLIVVLTHDGGDLLALSELENEVVESLGEVEGLTDVERVRGGVSPRWEIRPDYTALAYYGVEPSVLRQVIEYALEGRVLRERMEQGEPLALRARYDRSRSGGPERLESAWLPTRQGGSVHLGDVSSFALIEEPTHIERRENQRVLRVAAQLAPAGPGASAIAERVQDQLATMDLPSGVSWWLEGEIEAIEETRRTFMVAIGLALLMVLTLLLIQYGSVSYAVAGLLAIPLSGAGAMMLLVAMNRALDAMVLAGLLIAIGIVANNVILVLSQAQAAREEDPDLSNAEALNASARDRFRPILLTVTSTVLGMSPLILGGAEVFGLLQPLAIALTGALLLSIPVACGVLPGLARTTFSLFRGH
ncbi:MAG: efflux RND transporter permease subunit [Opitutales bacterium]|nr:efflux RND transporter permease subunit [Opitutales bacterium]